MWAHGSRTSRLHDRLCSEAKTQNEDLESAAPALRFLHELGEVQAIDATGFGQRAVSRHDGKRIKYYFEAVKTTALLDCETNMIIDVHCSMKQPHDSEIGWQVLTRNLDQLSLTTADKGYDCDNLRTDLRAHDIKSVIKYKEHWNLNRAHNARLDDDVYHLRPNVESTFFCAIAPVRSDVTSENLVWAVQRTRHNRRRQKHRTGCEGLNRVNWSF